MQRLIEQEKAEYLSKAKAQAEILITKTQGESQSMKIEAEAKMYQEQKKSESYLYQHQKEAEAIQAKLQAQAEGLSKLVMAFNGDTKSVIQYLMIQEGIYEKLAKESANAIQGLNPKINVWNTGPSTNDSFDSIRNLIKCVPPMVEGLEQNGNVQLPEWLVKYKNPEQSTTNIIKDIQSKDNQPKESQPKDQYVSDNSKISQQSQVDSKNLDWWNELDKKQ